MSDDYEFWVHGSAVVAQETLHLTGHRNGLFMMPLSWGTIARQDPGVNYFHIPMPTPRKLDDWPSYYQSARLRAKVGDQVEIVAVTVWSGDNEIKRLDFYDRNSDGETIGSSGPRGKTIDLPIDLPDAKVTNPLVMTIKVEWDEAGPASHEDRTITFFGAGINYEEKR